MSAFVGALRVISGGDDKTMRVWDPQTGDCLCVIDVDCGIWRVCCLEGGRVVTVDYDEKVYIWK